MCILKIFKKMLTAHKIKVFQSLDKKKFRQKYNLFFIEGNKIIQELKHSSYKIQEIFFYSTRRFILPETEIHPITERELKN